MKIAWAVHFFLATLPPAAVLLLLLDPVQRAHTLLRFSQPALLQVVLATISEPTVDNGSFRKHLSTDCGYHNDLDGLFAPATPRPRIIVTGGAGFIGSNLIKRLAKETGLGQVKVLDNFQSGRLGNLQLSDGFWAVDPKQVSAWTPILMIK